MSQGFTDYKVYNQKRDDSVPITNMNNMVFQIIPKLNQEVRKELEKKKKYFNKMNAEYGSLTSKTVNIQNILKKYKVSNPNQMKSLLNELNSEIELQEKRTKVEEKLNSTLSSVKYKTPVKQGDLVQLIHHDSTYFLGSKKSQGADQDKSCLMVCLMESGSFQSIWNILPSVNHKKQGDNVRQRESIILKNHHNGYQLNCSEDIPRKQYRAENTELPRINEKAPDRRPYQQTQLNLKEVNASPKQVEWITILQRTCLEDEDTSMLHCGDMLMVKHTALQGQLTADIYSSDLKELNEGNKACQLRIYKGAEPKEHFDSGMFFVLEKGNSISEQPGAFLNGEIAKQAVGKDESHKFRLKHVNSGRQVRMAEIDIIFKNKKKADKQERILGLSKMFESTDDKDKKDPNDQNDRKEWDEHTIFLIYSTSRETLTNVRINSYVKFKFFKVRSSGSVGQKVWMGFGGKEIMKSKDQYEDHSLKAKDSNESFYNKIEDDMQFLEKRTILLTESDTDDNSFQIEKVDPLYAHSFKCMHSSLAIVLWQVNKIKSGSAEMIAKFGDELQYFLTHMNQLLAWTQGHFDKVKSSAQEQRQPSHQKVARDIRLFDVMVDIVQQPYEVYKNSLDYNNIGEMGFLHEIQKIAQMIIRNSFIGQVRNEIQSAQWIRLQIDQTLKCNDKNSILAEKTLASLIKFNKRLLDKYINEELISNLIDSKDKIKNINLLASLCVCKGEAVKSKQNKIIELFTKNEANKKVFKEFFPKSEDIQVHGKGKIIIDQNGRIMKPEEFEWMKAAVNLVSNLCFDRNYKAIELFQDVYKFQVMHNNFIDRVEITQDIKAVQVTLIQHLILDKEPYKHVNQPIYTLEQPPVHESEDLDSENSTIENLKLMKKFINSFLSHGDVAADQDKVMNSVLNMIQFMCSHKIYTKTELTKLIKTVNKLIQDQVISVLGIKVAAEDPAHLKQAEEEEISVKSQITFFLQVVNMWFIDSSQDLSLFATVDNELNTGSAVQANTLKIIAQIDENALSLHKSLHIINYISQSRIHQSVSKFLKHTFADFKGLDINKPLKAQILLQMGIMPKSQQQKQIRNQTIMSQDVSQLQDVNLFHAVKDTKDMHYLTDFEHQVVFSPADTLNNFNLDINSFAQQYRVWTASVIGEQSELYMKAVNPLVWIKELLNENKVFDDPEDPIGVKTRFYELVLAQVSSSNHDLSFAAYKTLMDDLFTVDAFVNQLENLKLVDNDRLKTYQKKVDIIYRSLWNKLGQLSDVSNDMKKEGVDREAQRILIVQISKLIFWLIGMCINDQTKPHDYDFKSNHKTIDSTGFKNVEFMFEDLFQQQANIDVERDFNQLEEEMNTILKKMYCEADVEELNDIEKWKQHVFPRDYTMNEEVQNLQINLKIQDVMVEQLNQDTNDIEDGEHKNLIIALKCIVYRFLLFNAHMNSKILTDFQQYLPLLVLDLKSYLIAGQLYIEIVSNDKGLLKKLNTNDLYKICILLQQYDEIDCCEKAVGIKIFNKCIQQKQEVFKNNQNEVLQVLTGKGLSLLPKYFKKPSEALIAAKNEEDQLKAIKFMQAQINSEDGELPREEFTWIEVPQIVHYNLEYLSLMCSLTEKSNQQTEFNIKRQISFEKLLKMLRDSEHVLIVQRKIVQLIIDAFIDLEEIDDQEAESIENIESLANFLVSELEWIQTTITDDILFDRHQTLELVSNGPLTLISVRTVAEKFVYNQVIQLCILIYNQIKQQILEQNSILTLIRKILEFPAPAEEFAAQNLNQLVFLNVCVNLEVELSAEANEYLQLNNGANEVALQRVQQQLNMVSQTGQTVDSQDFVRENYLVIKYKAQQPVITEGGVKEKLTVLISLIKSSQLYQLMSFEKIRSFNIQMQNNTFFVNKPTIYKSLINIIINKHSALSKSYIVAGLKFLRLTVESQNNKRFIESIYWQTNDYDEVEFEIGSAQDMLIELGAVEVVVKLIVVYDDPEIIGESLLLSVALLLGGNPKAQNKFQELYSLQDQDNFMLKLQDMIDMNFNQIQHQQIAEQNSNRNQTRKTLELMNKVPCVDRDLFTNEKEVSHAQYIYSTSNYTQLDFTKTSLHDIDGNETSYREFKNNYKSEDLLDRQELNFRILKFLQNLCENHNHTLQEFVREQRKHGEISSKSRNFVDLLCQIQRRYFNIINKEQLSIGIQVVDTLIEFIQGPCRLNQIQIVKEKGLDTARDVLYNLKKKLELQQLGFYSEYDTQLISIIKQKTVVLINSLYEGNKNDEDFKIFDEIPKCIEQQILAERLVDVQCNQVWTQIISAEHKEEFKRSTREWDFKTRNDQIFKLPEIYDEHFISTKTLNDQQLQEGFNISILMLNIADQNKVFKQDLALAMTDETTKHAYNFFKVKICSIDVCIKDEIWRVYFPQHPYSRQLSVTSKKNFTENVDRETPVSKLAGLLNEQKQLQFEMKQQQNQNQQPIQPTPAFLQMLLDMLFVLAQVQNLMFLSFPQTVKCAQVTDCQPVLHRQYLYAKEDLSCSGGQCMQTGNNFSWFIGIPKPQLYYYKTLSKFLGFFQIVFGIIIFIVWYLTNYELLKYKQWQMLKDGHMYECEKILKTENVDEERIKDFQEKKIENLGTDMQKLRTILQLKGPDATEFVKSDNKAERNQITMPITIMKTAHDFIALISNQMFIQRLSHIIMSFMGSVVAEMFFIFHIQDIVPRHKDLQNIIYSITKNGEMLALTLVFTVVIVQVFSLISFQGFQESQNFVGTVDDNNRPQTQCNSIPNCLLFNMNNGIRGGGNHLMPISIHDPVQGARLLYDIAQIVIVVIVMLNIVFGIVIDTFGELQENNNTLKSDMENTCFICGLSRDSLEKQGISFDQHINYDHNWENQLYYIVHLSEKDRAYQNGVELEISEFIKSGETSFFPRKKLFGVQIDDDEGEANDEANAIIKEMLKSTNNIKNDLYKINALLDSKLNK